MTTFAINPAIKETRVTQESLAKLVDRALLRSRRRPRRRTKGRLIRIADLFSGCGAMTLGIEEACRALGFRVKPVIAIDINQPASDIYKRNFVSCEVKTIDIREILRGRLDEKLTSNERALKKLVGKIDIAIGGPPCQGHSDLNNHTRRRDPKNGLYFRMVRFAKVVQPTHIIIENVPAVVHDHGRVVPRAKNAFRKLGYQILFDNILDLRSLGVPQRRRRHILVASRSKSVSFGNFLVNYEKSSRSVGWAIGDLSNMNGSVMDRKPELTPAAIRRIRHLFDKGLYELPNRYRPKCHRSNNHSYKSVYGRLRWGQPAQTITSGFMCMGQGRYVHPRRRRTLTPREAARLQFIPDFFDFGEKIRSTMLAEIIGNAVPPKLSYAIAVELLR